MHDDKALFLATVPLFEGLPRNSLEELASVASWGRYKKGEMIFHESDPGRGFFIVASGRVKVFKVSFEGKEQILHVLGPSEPFGEAAVFAGWDFPANAVAMEETTVMYIPRSGVLEQIKKDPSLAMNMLAVLSMRLRKFSAMIEDLSLKGVPGRLAAYLLLMARQKGEGKAIELDVTKTDLASILGTIPETLSRILRKMQDKGMIKVEGASIEIADGRGLEEVAERGLI